MVDPAAKKDFFVSYNKADVQKAEWIAWTLEENGYTTILQAWDFHDNFVLDMHAALQQTHRLIAVLSPDYLASRFTQPEWAARFAEDPTGEKGLLVPVRVRACDLDGLLAPIIYADLVDVDEPTATERLLDKATRRRRKPGEKPAFTREALPAGVRNVPDRPAFAGPILHNLPPANPDFVGRERALAEIGRLLSADRPIVVTQAITGLGGIGKSQTALAFAHAHRDECSLVAWFPAAEPATLAVIYAQLASRLGVIIEEQAAQITATKTALESMSDWLLIFDNVDDPFAILAYLPSGGRGRILLTSRRTDFEGVAGSFDLQLMTEPEALELLARRKDWANIPPQDVADAKGLCEELGYLPLALAQAQSLCQRGTTFAEYRTLLVVAAKRLLDRGLREDRYPKSVARTWDISVAAAENQSPGARDLLEILSLFAPAPLPRRVLEANPDALEGPLTDALNRADAIAALATFSLIQVPARDLLTHRLVQAVTRDAIPAEKIGAIGNFVVRLLRSALPSEPNNHLQWEEFTGLLPHSGHISSLASLNGIDLPKICEILNETAYFCRLRGDIDRSEHLYSHVIDILKNNDGENTPLHAQILNNRSVIYRLRGDLNGAARDITEAIEIAEQNDRSNPSTLAAGYNNLGEIYREMGIYLESRRFLRKSMSILDFNRLDKTIGAAMVHDNLGNLYSMIGNFPWALLEYSRGIDVAEAILGSNHPEISIRRAGRALTLVSLGRIEEAETALRAAITNVENCYGIDHPALAAPLCTLAQVVEKQGDIVQAEDLYNRDISITEKKYGNFSSELATSLHNKAELLKRSGRFLEAAPLYEQSLEIIRARLPPDHPHLYVGLQHFADLLSQMGRLAEASRLNAEAEEIRRRRGSANDSRLS